MLPIRWTKVLRDLSSHWFRTMLVVLSIAIGVFAVGVIMGGREILVREFDSEYLASAPRNAALHTADFDDQMVRRVRAYPGVTAAQGRRSERFRYTWRGSDTPRSLSLVAFQDFGDISVEKVVREDASHWPPRRGEIVLESSVRETGDYQIGDIIQVEVKGEEEPVPFTVIGFAHDVNAYPAQFMGAETGFISFASLPALDKPTSFNELLVRFDPQGLTQRTASLLAEDIKRDVFEANNMPVYAMEVPKPGSHFLGDIFKAVSLLLLAMGVLALGLSGFLVINTVASLMAQQVRQVGIMKAVGGRASQVTWMYLAMVAIYGVLAVLVGVPATAWVGQKFVVFAADTLNVRVGSYVPARWVTTLEVAVGLVVPVLAAIVPVRSGTRTSVVKALNATGVSSAHFGHGLVDRALGLITGLPRPVALSLRNTFLRKGRLALTLATLSLASAVVMSVFSVQASIAQSIDDLDAWWRYDMQVNVSDGADRAAVEREVLAVDGVRDVESWMTASTSLTRKDGTKNETLFTMGLPWNTTFVAPTVVSGRWLEPGDTDAVVVNTDAVNEESALDVGQRVTLTIMGVEKTWHVVGVIKGQMSGPIIFADREALATALGNGAVSRVSIKATTSDPDEQVRILERVEKRLEDASYPVAGTRTVAGLKEQVASQLGILVSFLVIMAVLLASVGVIGLTGTMSINVIESTREIGVMRAIGAGHNSIYQIFITEGLVVGNMSWAVGAIAAYPLSYWLTTALSGAIGIPLSYRFSWMGVVAWLAVMSVISVIASIAPAFRAAQVSVRDAIAYE